MITAIIVDDEEKSRKALKNLVTKYCPMVQIMELCNSVTTAVKSIETHTPDLVFLDIEMPHESGFSLFEKIRKPDFDVIFVTAYNHYAIKAIKYSALDYLLKPVSVEELKFAVKKIQNKQNNQPDKFKKVEVLLSNIKNKSVKIAIPTFEGLQMVNAENIIKCTADDSYTQISIVGGKKILVSKILKDYEELLEEFNFMRVHNSCLINLIHVTKYIKGDGGSVIMTDGELVEVARRKKNELISRLSLIQL